MRLPAARRKGFKVKARDLLLPVLCVIASCAPARNGLIIRDDDLNPVGACNQLELGNARGMLGHGIYPPGSDEPSWYFENMGSGKKSWVLENWGEPDERSSANGIEYLVYTKRSRSAPRYGLQEEGYVKLGFRGRRMVMIEAWFPNCPPYMEGPVHTLPK